MTLPVSGAISFNNINVELGVAGTTQASLGQSSYRTLAGVASGAISMSNFYGKSNRAAISYTFSTNTANASLDLSTISGYAAGTSDITVTINAGIYLYSTSTGGYGLNLTGGTTGDTLTIVNNGYIMGMGGAGGYHQGGSTNMYAGSAGGPALNFGFGMSGATVTNTSGYIGGGGGGGGAAGWFSGVSIASGGGGGAGGAAGGGTYGTSGGGGGGVGATGSRGSSAGGDWNAGGGGGRIMPGTGGAGGTLADAPNRTGRGGGSGGGGGSSYNSSESGDGGTSGGGGGGWGASGGNAAASGIASIYGGTGGSAGSAGTAYTPNNGPYQQWVKAGGAGGKAINLNAKSITWTGGASSSSRAYGAVS